MDPREQRIGDAVDAVFGRCRGPLSTLSGTLDLCEEITGSVFDRASLTLGAVTVRAIACRVIDRAGERHGTARHLDVSEDGIDFDRVRGRASALDAQEIAAATREIVVSLIRLIDALTAGVLTPALEETLLAVEPRESRAAK